MLSFSAFNEPFPGIGLGHPVWRRDELCTPVVLQSVNLVDTEVNAVEQHFEFRFQVVFGWNAIDKYYALSDVFSSVKVAQFGFGNLMGIDTLAPVPFNEHPGRVQC